MRKSDTNSVSPESIAGFKQIRFDKMTERFELAIFLLEAFAGVDITVFLWLVTQFCISLKCHSAS